MRVIMPHSYLKNCEYKYVVCREVEGIIIWGFRGLKFHLPDSFSFQIPFRIFLFGVIEANGCQIFQEELKPTEKGFTLTILIPLWISAFKMMYNYRILSKNGQWRFERGEKRYIKHNFLNDNATQPIESNQESYIKQNGSPSFYSNSLKKENIYDFKINESSNSEEKGAISSLRSSNNNTSQSSFCEKKAKHSILKIKDKPFNDQFEFVKITEGIILGPCPQTKEDIEKLKKEKIDAVLNLQRDEEMIRKGVDWEEMIGFYKMEKIFVHKLGIKDKKPEAIAGELVEAAGILNSLLQKYKVF